MWWRFVVWRTFRQYWNGNEGDDDVDELSSDNEEVIENEAPVIAKCYFLPYIQINTWQLQKLTNTNRLNSM